MIYKATIIINGSKFAKEFNTLSEAAQWLDSENNNLEATTLIETYDEAGRKKDGFFYSEKRK